MLEGALGASLCGDGSGSWGVGVGMVWVKGSGGGMWGRCWWEGG